MPLNEEGLIDRVSIRHSVSADAVRTILRALRSGNGTMAQFSHPDFGGMSQWSPGMSMVGEMFNTSLKSKLDAVCTELAAYVAQTASTDARSGAWRPVNPVDGDHQFRLMTTTCSGRWRPGQQGCGRA
jgi:hypothetical protein